MNRTQIATKIDEITNTAQKIQQSISEQQQQFIACQGALQVLHELLQSCEDDKKEGEKEDENA